MNQTEDLQEDIDRFIRFEGFGIATRYIYGYIWIRFGYIYKAKRE